MGNPNGHCRTRECTCFGKNEEDTKYSTFLTNYLRALPLFVVDLVAPPGFPDRFAPPVRDDPDLLFEPPARGPVEAGPPDFTPNLAARAT